MYLTALIFSMLMIKSLPQTTDISTNNLLNTNITKRIKCYNNTYNLTKNDFKNISTDYQLVFALKKILDTKATKLNSSNVIYTHEATNKTCGISLHIVDEDELLNINYGFFNKNNCSKNLSNILCTETAEKCKLAIACCGANDLLHAPCNNDYTINLVNLNDSSYNSLMILRHCGVKPQGTCVKIQRNISNISATTAVTTEIPTTAITIKTSTTNSAINLAQLWYTYLLLLAFLNN